MNKVLISLIAVFGFMMQSSVYAGEGSSTSEAVPESAAPPTDGTTTDAPAAAPTDGTPTDGTTTDAATDAPAIDATTDGTTTN